MTLRYLKETEIQPYIEDGKIIEQYIGKFKNGEFDTHRYISLGKNKTMYYALIHEVFDESDEYPENIYDYPGIDPDEQFGLEIGEFDSLRHVLEKLKDSVNLNSDKFHITGYLNEIAKQ